MEHKAAQVSITAWASNGILLERYAYGAGAVEPLPKHAHEEYQFGLSFDCQGEYRYRGTRHAIPTGSLSVIHSGEVHAPSDRTSLPNPAHFAMMHIHPGWLQTVLAEMTEKSAALPFFPAAFFTDAKLNRLFLALAAADWQNSKLEQNVALWEFLSHLIRHYASDRAAVSSSPPAHGAVELARDYLHAHYASDVSLEELAAIAGLSRFHFCRVFHRKVGVSVSAYQTQLRIAQAKKLLLQGLPIATVATATGFYDQSHFGGQFKRQVGVTPARYVSRLAIIS
ncbi:helix-turn-helix transcriptional regulator [Romeria aff. gracilis LEGE 07310]|uniref:Helix-turn-helix transcriptional regulator n=1 Tax=Vasconcelosia minhoensis LEGE 07310 TaxID=915328 RepID=A0A8J7AUG3_9CYAN|nr:AraC family transcriptional regulator [Romeria gracilis]MBE9075717.1 helix-turn-helix transcriptional regulator [Romeria aff. gracilis LEGE 07310]